MYKPRPGGARVATLRRRIWTVGLCAALFVTFLPLSIMLAGMAQSCPEPGLDPSSLTWFQTMNPYSQFNLCKNKGTPVTVPVHNPVESVAPTVTPQPDKQEQVQSKGGEPASTPAGQDDKAKAEAAEAKAAQEREAREAEAKAAKEREAKEKEEADAKADKEKEEQKRKAEEATAAQKAREAEAKQAKEAQEQKDKEAAERKASSGSTPAATAKPAAHHGRRQEDLDSVTLPQSEDDYERILRMPYYEDCNLCKVCVPRHVVGHHAKAKARLDAADTRYLQSLDPDVTVYVPHPPGKGAAARQLLQAPATARSSSSSRRLQEDDELEPESKEAVESDEFYRIKGQTIDMSDIAPGNRLWKERGHLPNCSVCWGCEHTLEMMASGTVMRGSYYSHEPGGSPSWLFRARTNRTKSGWAVVKAWCVPVRKAKQRGLASCSPQKVYSQVKLLLAQQKVVHECGLNDIVPSLWVEPVSGVIPGHGFRVNWLGLWADIADGLSVQNIQEYGNPKTDPGFVLELLQQRVNHTSVKHIAIFDVMFSQCDRHQQNIFLTEEGKVWAIDNDQVSGTAWRRCGFDSMVLPTTQKFMINHLGFFYVMKYPHKDPPRTWVKTVNPLLLLDYRCHVEGGAIGFNFTPSLQKCMRHMSGLTSGQLQQQYGFPTLRMASGLRNRSSDMLSKGFEWTLLHGQPANQPMHRYKVAPHCCSMTFDRKTNDFKCTDPTYKQMSELPYGNPWHGGSWHGTANKDTGSYVGGTVF